MLCFEYLLKYCQKLSLCTYKCIKCLNLLKENAIFSALSLMRHSSMITINSLFSN